MAERKFLDLQGLEYYTRKLKNGVVLVGRAAVADQVASTGIQWGTELIPIANIPKAALERCVVVANDTERFKLTTAQAQNGDTVKVEATKKMFFVKDDTKLNSEAGYEPYVAGTASVAEVAESVEWNNVRNKPETFPPSNHGTNVVTSLRGFSPSFSMELVYEEIDANDTLNQALNKLQRNDYRVLQSVDIHDINLVSSVEHGIALMSQIKGITQFTLTDDGGGKNMIVGVLMMFADTTKNLITQIAETRYDLYQADQPSPTGYYYTDSAQGSQRYIRHFKLTNNGGIIGAKGQWTKWIPYHGEYTKQLIDAAKQEGTDAKAIATAAKNELADFRRITESEIDALL